MSGLQSPGHVVSSLTNQKRGFNKSRKEWRSFFYATQLHPSIAIHSLIHEPLLLCAGSVPALTSRGGSLGLVLVLVLFVPCEPRNARGEGKRAPGHAPGFLQSSAPQGGMCMAELSSRTNVFTSLHPGTTQEGPGHSKWVTF